MFHIDNSDKQHIYTNRMHCFFQIQWLQKHSKICHDSVPCILFISSFLYDMEHGSTVQLLCRRKEMSTRRCVVFVYNTALSDNP